MSVQAAGIVIGIGIVSATVFAVAIVCNSDRAPRRPVHWHGIDPAVSTCQPDVKAWLQDRTTCISAGTFYTCLLNRDQRMYECAPGLAPAEAP